MLLNFNPLSALRGFTSANRADYDMARALHVEFPHESFEYVLSLVNGTATDARFFEARA